MPPDIEDAGPGAMRVTAEAGVGDERGKPRMNQPLSPYKIAKKNRRRREILDAAAAVIAERGYHAASMKDIAERLRMRPSSLYHYLDSKEAALRQICVDGSTESQANIEALRAHGRPAVETIRSAIVDHLRHEMRDHVECFVFHRRNLSPAVTAELDVRAQDYHRVWISLFERGLREGVLPADLDCRFAATTVLGLINGIAHSLRGKSDASVDDMARRVARFFLAGIGAAPAAQGAP
jgi:AcrR family transcriptional regulator